jgi:uncharacterized protein (TIGR01777 family)
MTAQALLGGLDNLWHHEIGARLPVKRSATGELSLHAAREFIYAWLFLALGWFRWHGRLFAGLIAGALLLEVFITLKDFVVEDQTRRLPASERVLHTVMAINFGAILVLLATQLKQWWSSPAGIESADYGALSWLFTVFAVGALLWSVRNALAVLDLKRPAEWVREPIAAATKDSGRAVLISGATGFIGAALVRYLIGRGDRVVVLTRDADLALDRFGPRVRIVTRLEQIEDDARIDAIVNLGGAPILALPWTRARRVTLIKSRVQTTRALIDVAARLTRTPKVLVSASAVGFYGVRGDELVGEESSPTGDFQSRLCQAWEAAADGARNLGVRVVRLRIGLVLGRTGGALPQFLRPFRWGMGALLGSGRQWVSWIHIEDLVRLIDFAIDTAAVRGALNAVAPRPVTHLMLQRALGNLLHRPLWIKVPTWVMRSLLGEMSQLLVEGQRVVSSHAVALGFRFYFPHLEAALEQLLKRPPLGSSTARVYFNGECPVCRAEMGHYEKLCGTDPALTFIDATRHPGAFADCGLRLDHLERRVYVRNSQGQIASGMPALIALWASLPRYRALARLLSLPVLHQGAVLLYDHVISPTLARWANRRMRVRLT